MMLIIILSLYCYLNREECEELRSHQSRIKRDELFAERKTQIAEKMGKKEQEQEIEQMYAELWEQDRLAKAKREEEDEQQQMERNREMIEVIFFSLIFHSTIFL